MARPCSALAGLSLFIILLSGCLESRAQSRQEDDLLDVILWGGPALIQDVTSFENLDLEQCIRIAIVHNLGLDRIRRSVESSRQDLRSAKNAFDFQGTVSAEHLQDIYTPEMELGTIAAYDPLLQQTIITSATSSVIDEDLTTLRSTLRKQFKTGGFLTLQPRLQHSDSQRNRWSSGATLNFTQPLLDGFGYDVTTAGLKSTRLSLEQSEYNLDASLRALVVNVVRDYYTLLKTRMILDEQEKALQRSEEQLRAAQIRKQEGEVPQLDVLRAELQMARNQNSLISTRNALTSQLINLKLRMGLPLETEVDIAPLEVRSVTVEISLEELTEYALNNRLDLKSDELSYEQARLALLTARNRKLPNLDLTASYHFIDRNDKLGRVWDFDQGSVNMGILFTMPLGDVSDDVRLKKARISLEQAETGIEERRRLITSEVDAAVRQLETLRQQIDLLQKNVEIAEESFRLSRLSYEIGGLISSFDLTQTQDDLTAARTSYLSTLIDYKIGLAQLDLARGLDLPTLIEEQIGRPIR